ncbi:P-loop containing nucleoside triphosphate hydrolase protein [Thozetella sp. PMI_491]|nr:P-loop containing nucleoside triphosphate hydrolase protein [Thozetella sp. PMI_491]
MKPRKSGFGSHVKFLSGKDLTILVSRHFVSTLYAALILPLLMTIYLGIGQNLQGSGNKYGIAEPRTVRSLSDGLAAAESQRSNVVFVNNGLAGGDIDHVISALEDTVIRAGKTAHRAVDTIEMGRICAVSFQGTTPCYGAVVFHASPNEGEGGIWNYTLRGDAVLGRKFNVDKNDNDPQIYVLPLQRALDAEIARLEQANVEPSALDSMQEWLFTDQPEEERKAEANRDYQNTFINFMGVSVLLAFFGISYHLTGYIATEREMGMSQLIDAMMFTSRRWEPQAARMKQTSAGIVLPYFILSGLASTSQALISGTLFKKAQLSSVASGLIFLLLGVLVQAVPSLGTALAVILAMLFTPCNMVLQIKYMARYEATGYATNLLKPPNDSDHSIPSIVLWFFLIFQIAVCPFLAAGLERWLHGAAADSRMIWTGPGSGERPRDAVMVQGLTKTFSPSLLRRLFSFVAAPRPPTVAVNNLNLSVPRGQIVALLGANGCGKSTTLDSIAGLQGFRNGKVTIDGSGGIGIAPQRNVLWDELTVWEHVRLFNRLKAPFNHSTEQELRDLLRAVSLDAKKDTKSGVLSGGQKRKLQLAMMLTGGSSVCCVDEVSSGIDPLSRRKIWDILLAERGSRTIILTTHFLDEADLLSDKIAIMSKGVLRAEGSAVELKANLGSGFRIHLSRPRDHQKPPPVEGVQIRVKPDSVAYIATSSELAARVIRTLEAANISYRLSSPTMEDVFLQSAEEYASEVNGGPRRLEKVPLIKDYDEQQSLGLQSGCHVGILKQTVVLLNKRLTLLKNDWLPYLIAFLIPVIAAAAMRMLVSSESRSTCAPEKLDQMRGIGDFNELLKNVTVVAGPAVSVSNVSTYSAYGEKIDLPTHTVDSFSALASFIKDHRKNIYPGGFWSGSTDGPATVISRADSQGAMSAAIIAQNLLDSTLFAIRIAVSYVIFDTPFGAVGKTLQLAIFFSVAISITPAFLSLYPNLERRTNVRSLQYSSGVRVLAQWSSHLLFDFSVLVLPLVAAALIFAFTTGVFWNPGYLVPIFLLYAIAAVLLGYILSLFTNSQLATWAAVTVFNGVGLAIYFISLLFVTSLSEATKAQGNILLAHYIISIVFPLGSLMRGMLVSLNIFYQACDGQDFVSSPGEMNAYGGPILYLALQSCLYFCALLLSDSKVRILGLFSSAMKRKQGNGDIEKVERIHPGLQVQRLTKSFGDLKVVDDLSFEIKRGEVFALLGPNGAGKSTTIGMIRGDIRPSDGDVLVEQFSITGNRSMARASMGVCPQFDAIDEMTTEEHLRHYTRLRGITEVSRQVDAIIRAVGLEEYRETMAGHLSGGNKRKISLGMALTGNPSTILLDEPSSGLDAAAKRIMWHTLKAVVPGRSILLTTHSMEEADTLASRAGIVAKSMLAMGDIGDLQRRFGDSLYVHLVRRTAPHSTDEEMKTMRAGILDLFPSAEIEEKTYHGQMRFSVPAAALRERNQAEDGIQDSRHGSTGAIGLLLVVLEDNRDRLGIQHHSVSPTTLNDVFLAIVGQNQVQEEGYRVEDNQKKKNWRKILLGF